MDEIAGNQRPPQCALRRRKDEQRKGRGDERITDIDRPAIKERVRPAFVDRPEHRMSERRKQDQREGQSLACFGTRDGNDEIAQNLSTQNDTSPRAMKTKAA